MELELAVPGPDGEAGYEFGDPKMSEDECRLRDQTYAAPLRVRMRLRIKSGDAEGERSEEHTSELQSRQYLVCRLLLEKKKNIHSISSEPSHVLPSTSANLLSH